MSFRPTATAGPSTASNTTPFVVSTSTGAVRKAYTPPLFGSFGKKAKDLFKKKYEFDHQAKIINTTADGATIETSVIAGVDAPLRGVFHSTVPVRTLGVLNGVAESEFHTVADRESKLSYKLTKLAPGLSVKVGLTGVKPEIKGETPDFPEGYASVEAEYAQEYVSAVVGVRSNKQKTLVDGALALGYDNLSVGGKVTVDTASRNAPSDYNFGAQLEGSDYVASATTEKKHSVLNLSYFQAVGRGHTVGASATFGLVKPSRTLTFGTDYMVDVDTTVRAYAKVDSAKDTTVLATNIQHKLLKPNMLLGASAEFNITPSNVTASKFGLALTFGDF